MEILYRDQDLTVCIKPPQLLSEQTPEKNGLADLIAEENGGYVGVIHRLDRGVGGVMVYANTPRAAAKLSASVQQHALQKEYLAVVHGKPAAPCGTLRDLLFHDRKLNKSFVVSRERTGVKEAILDYTVQKSTEIEPYGTLSLIRVRLHTGRTHQIRVQFSSRALPLLGDGKYGASGDRCPIALFSAHLAFPHPRDGRKMTFDALPAGDVWERLLEN